MKSLAIKILHLLKFQCKKDEEISKHIADLVPDSTTPVFTTPLVEDTINLFFKGEYCQYCVFQYLLDIENDSEAEQFLEEKVNNGDIHITISQEPSKKV